MKIETNFDTLEKQREKMRAPLIDINLGSHWEVINILTKTGIEIDPNTDIIDHPYDGTIIYKAIGVRVLLYIREQHTSIYNSDYKFHIHNCRTLKTARQSNRYNKYVVATRTDGMFEVFHNGRKKLQQMHVCKNCLLELNYKDYNNHWQDKNMNIYNEFSLEEFFNIYGEQDINRPDYTDATAPLNYYTENWRKIANEEKSRKRYICECCGRDFSQLKQFLHVHHNNFLKWDNNPQNLKVLCIECHSKQSGHAHLNNSREYREYKEYKKNTISLFWK
jgi:5-methylcytosine-specific restriction endonuclease McrA